MIGLRCLRCGTVYEKGSRCPACVRKYNTEKRDKQRAKFYRTKEWLHMREKVKQYYCNVDIWLLGLTGYISPCARPIVHHIQPYEYHPELALTMTNLVCVSSASHNYIHEWYDAGKYEDAVEILRKGQRLYEEFKNDI